MNKRQKQKDYKKHIIALSKDGREFKSEASREAWVKDTLNGWGTAFRKHHYK